MRELGGMDVGYGVGVKMPPSLSSHEWICTGTPDPALTDAMRAGIRGECPLPPPEALFVCHPKHYLYGLTFRHQQNGP